MKNSDYSLPSADPRLPFSGGASGSSQTDSEPLGDDSPRNPFLVSTSGENDSAAAEAGAPDGSVFGSPGQPTSGELVQAVRTIETKNTGGFTKLLVLFVSLGLFVAAGIAWWNPRMIAMLVVVLLFHEAGHFLAMKAFGYRNVRMFFIPFLGAAVSGRHFNISGWKKAIVYLAGPVPGIVAALPLMWFGSTQEIDWMFELGGMSLFLNTLNLLPIMPLDGGWIMHLTVFSRSPLLELLARVAGIGMMLAFAFFAGSKILLFFAIPLIISLPTTFRVSKLIRHMRTKPLPSPGRDEIPDDAIRLLDEEMQSTALSEVATPQKAALIVQIYESLIVRPPGVLATLAIWTMYGGAFLTAAVGGTTMFAMRGLFWNVFLDEGMFESTSQIVSLDASDTQFFLGSEPIEESLLSVARFDSPSELSANLKRIDASDRQQYTHVRIGNVLLATVPKQSVMRFDDVNHTAGDAEEDELDPSEFRERMKLMLQPVDPRETWLAPIVAPAGGTNQGKHSGTSIANSPLPGRPVVHVISGMHHDSIQLLCRAPNEELARQVVETDFQMLGVTADRLYIPSWSPIDPPTQQQLANRQVLKTLVNGITVESAPQLFEMRQKLYQAQYKSYDDESQNGDPTATSARTAKLRAKVRAIEAKYTADLIAEFQGQQAELAIQYQAFQRATHRHAEIMERRQLVKQTKPTELGEQVDQAEYGEAEKAYPTMEQFLDPHNQLLGFGDSTRTHYAFAAHVSGDVLTADQYAREIDIDASTENWDEDEWEAEQREDLDGEAIESEVGQFVSLHLHRATDYTATVSAIIAYLQRRGFTDFSLHYVIPTGDFD